MQQVHAVIHQAHNILRPIQNITIQYNTQYPIPNPIPWTNTKHNNTIQYPIPNTQYPIPNTIQYNTIQYNTIQYQYDQFLSFLRYGPGQPVPDRVEELAEDCMSSTIVSTEEKTNLLFRSGLNPDSRVLDLLR